MNGYTKIFQSIVTSTIWQEPNDCRVLWVTILALKGGDQICNATIPALAKFCNLTIKETEKYLQQFQKPDKYSRSQEFEGRRIEKVEGGFLVLNGKKYSDLLRSSERRDYICQKVAEHRKKVKENNRVTDVNNVNNVNPPSPSPSPSPYPNKYKLPSSPNGDVKGSFLEESFKSFWNAYPRRIGKGAAFRAWKRIKPDEGTVSTILNALKCQKGLEQWQKEGGQFIPHPTTWLNQERWNDEFKKEEIKTGGSFWDIKL